MTETLRSQFEQWARLSGWHDPRPFEWELWQAAYRAGEIATLKQVEVYEHCSDCAECMKVIAGRLRALEPDTDSKRLGTQPEE